jgi:hypothetical protein
VVLDRLDVDGGYEDALTAMVNGWALNRPS